MYLLLPALLVGIWRMLKAPSTARLFLLLFIIGTAVPLSVVLANLGTLFRLRLLFFLPLLTVVAVGDPGRLYARLFQRITRSRGVREETAVADPGETAQPVMTGR